MQKMTINYEVFVNNNVSETSKQFVKGFFKNIHMKHVYLDQV